MHDEEELQAANAAAELTRIRGENWVICRESDTYEIYEVEGLMSRRRVVMPVAVLGNTSDKTGISVTIPETEMTGYVLPRARVIAAAPDMLALLVRLQGVLGSHLEIPELASAHGAVAAVLKSLGTRQVYQYTGSALLPITQPEEE